jgi:hypothetical protein
MIAFSSVTLSCLATAVSLLPLTALPATIDDLEWLSGCWAAANQDAGSGEQWMPPAGGTMLGISRSVRDGRTVAFEFIRIAEQADGELVFIASPSGQNTTQFSMTSLGDREVIFENPDHDFPQRIIYRLISDEELLGRVEGTINGAERTLDFPMKKIDCETS